MALFSGTMAHFRKTQSVQRFNPKRRYALAPWPAVKRRAGGGFNSGGVVSVLEWQTRTNEVGLKAMSQQRLQRGISGAVRTKSS